MTALFSHAPYVHRSELSCPAHSLRMMSKAAASEADVVIFDLEDSCSLPLKLEARRTLIEALKTLDFAGKLRGMRTNHVRSKLFYHDLIDIVESAGAQLDLIVLPKVDVPDDIHFVDRLLTQIEQNSGMEVGRIRLEIMIESAKALLSAHALACASPRVAALAFGMSDYAADVGAKELTGEQFQIYHYPKAHIIAAARAAGIDAVDNSTLQFRDQEQCRRDAQRAVQMGFDGKRAIHPDQIAAINEAFTPSTAEAMRAKAVVDVFMAQGFDPGLGGLVYAEQLIDPATVRGEWKKVAIAKKAGLM